MIPRDGEWPDYDPPSEPSDPLIVDCAISSPANGSTVKGPWNGVTVVVSGTASVTSGVGAIERVEVQVGGGEFKRAASAAAGWSEWSASELITYAGSVAIVARAIVDGRVARQRSLTISTALDPKPAEPDPDPVGDTTPPAISITGPRSGTAFVIDGTGTAEITVTGTASDPGGAVEGVEVLCDGLVASVTKAGDGWSNWTAMVQVVGRGRHTIAARAFDAAGLEMQSTVEVEAVTQPPKPPVVERLVLVEKLRLSTYLGAYGAGRTIKTLSLLPGEKTKMAVKSYRRTAETATETSSILDSYSDESQQDFENTLTREQSNRNAVEESTQWNVSGQASAGWGWGSASISAGATGSTAASREELAKNVANAVTKHAQKASSKRDVEVKTSREMKTEEGEEFSSESQIENINVSRTLNLVFRQMNQEFITVLHLVDVRIAYIRGDVVEVDGEEEVRYSYQEATLSQLDSLLRRVIVPERRHEVRDQIVKTLSHVFDYQDEPHAMVEEKALLDSDGNPIPNGTYLRVPAAQTSTYVDPATRTEIVVPGMILSVVKNVMRTDGVLCDAILGKGDALDYYSTGLQNAAVEARRIENRRQKAALERDELAMEIVKSKDNERARVFKEVYPTPETESLALVTTSSPDGTA